MLASADDAALARLVIAATSIPRRVRLSWLRDIASRAENPSARLAATPRHAPAAATPCTSTASKLSDSRPRAMPARPRTVSGRLISLGAPTKHRRHCSMPQPRRRRHGPQPHRRRALELLAASRHGATEAILLASVFLLLTEVAGLAGMMKCRLQGLSTRRRVSLFTVAIFFIAH